MVVSSCSDGSSSLSQVSQRQNNFRRLLLTFEALADLGSQMTADRDFADTATSILVSLLGAVDARQGALFVFRDKPALLSALASAGYDHFPAQPVIPLLPKHVHALTALRGPEVITAKSYEAFLSANGNVAPELFKLIVPLQVRGKLIGLVGMGGRENDGVYGEEELESLRMLCHYVALAIHNHTLSESLTQRVSEHLRLLASVQSFYDNALETFANAIDIKHVNIRGHSLRVGRYAALIGEAIGMEVPEVSALRSSGYLHDIGKVAVDKRLFEKPSKLNADEFREMADHTIIGHQIVTGVQFPWPHVPEVVRSHHERADGSGYPDKLRMEEILLPVRVIGLADSFDAMISDRPYRRPHSVGEALSEILRQTPVKFDAAAVQGLLIQVRRDAVGGSRNRFLDERAFCNIAPTDVDSLASLLNHKLTSGRVYVC